MCSFSSGSFSLSSIGAPGSYPGKVFCSICRVDIHSSNLIKVLKLFKILRVCMPIWFSARRMYCEWRWTSCFSSVVGCLRYSCWRSMFWKIARITKSIYSAVAVSSCSSIGAMGNSSSWINTDPTSSVFHQSADCVGEDSSCRAVCACSGLYAAGKFWLFHCLSPWFPFPPL